MYEPNVTIITPTSNIVENEQADDFTLLINLLDKQTYPEVEHIIIDNASSDGTEVLLKEYKNSGFISFFSEPDRGKFDAMNKGLLRAKGKYVAFLSCDDFYQDITAIAGIVEAMEENDADFCYFPAYCCPPDGYVFEFTPAILNTFQVSPCARQALFFKKSVLSELRGFDEKFKLLADYDLIIRLVMGGYNGILYDKNVVTYKLGTQVSKYTTQVEAECNHIFYKNFKPLYPLTDEQLNRMVNLSEIPRPLLDKLANIFPDEYREMFFERYQQMYNMRLENARALKEQERRNRY